MTSANVRIAIAIVVPISIWVVHIVYLVPLLGELSGDTKFNTAMRFFAVAAIVMTACQVVTLDRWRKMRDAWSVIGVCFNLTWLYYVKVLLYGPTVGDF